jgi:hypothetical protein
MEAAHVRQKMRALWKTMLKALAEASGCFQEKLSSTLFGFDPQNGKARTDLDRPLWILGKRPSTPQTSADVLPSSCLLKFDKAINPGFRASTNNYRLSFYKDS